MPHPPLALVDLSSATPVHRYDAEKRPRRARAPETGLPSSCKPPARGLSVVSTPQDNIPITRWPVHERPRERLQKLGATVLSDAELLALFIRTGTRGHNAIDIARTLLLRCGSLSGVLQADDTTLDAVPGIGPAKRAQLRVIQETVRRTLGETLSEQGTALDNAVAVADYLRLMIGHRPREVFVALFLDCQCRLLRAEEMAQGTVDRSAVYPREIAKRALSLNASGLIVAHNHPSGALLPSPEDKALTRQLRAGLSLLGISLLDHLIVTSHGYFSFADDGILH
jgi:DNA repair protein RadC